MRNIVSIQRKVINLIVLLPEEILFKVKKLIFCVIPWFE